MSEHWQVENGYNTSFITGSNPVLTATVGNTDIPLKQLKTNYYERTL
jgi:hypothetical protein